MDKPKKLRQGALQPSIAGSGHQNADWRPVQKKMSRVTHSPFYYVLEELINESHASIQSLKIKKINNDRRNAFILNICSIPMNHLFADYEYQDRHFSVDKTYKSSTNTQHGRTPIHYTETYISSMTGERLVVHGYLNQQGCYVYAQIKKRSYGIDNPIVLEIDETLNERIRANIRASTGFISFLFQERQVRYIESKKQVDHCENELAQLIEELKKSVTQVEKKDGLYQKYVAMTQKFLTTVTRLNFYSEIKYSSRLLAIRMEYLASLAQEVQGLALSMKKITESSAKQDITVDSLEPVLQTPIEDPLVPVIAERLEKFRINANTLHSFANKGCQAYDLDQLLKIKPVVDIINQELFWVFEIPAKYFSQSIKKSFKRCLNHLDTNLQTYDSELLLRLENAIKSGNRLVVEKLFPAIGHRLKDDIYKTIIDKLIEESADNTRKYIEVCDYLYENTQQYIDSVSYLSRESSYVFSEKEFTTFISQLKLSIDENDPKLSRENVAEFKASIVSGLFKLYCKNNLEAFEMLLRHGADPNTWALLSSADTYKTNTAAAVLSAIVGFYTPDYVKYLKALARHNVDLSVVRTPSAIKRQLQEKIGNTKAILKANQKLRNVRSKNPLTLVGQAVEHEELSAVVVAGRYDFEAVKALLPYSTIDDVAYCFSCLLGTNDIVIKRFFCNKKPFIKVVADKIAANAIESQYKTLTWGSALLPSLVFYLDPLPESKRNQLGVKEKYLQILNFIFEIFYQKVKAISTLEEFHKVYNRLFSKGQTRLMLYKDQQDEPSQIELTCANRSFYGCHLLLTAVSEHLYPAPQLELAQKYLVKLLQADIVILQQQPPSVERERSISEYKSKIFSSQHRMSQLQRSVQSSEVGAALQSPPNIQYGIRINGEEYKIIGIFLRDIQDIIAARPNRPAIAHRNSSPREKPGAQARQGLFFSAIPRSLSVSTPVRFTLQQGPFLWQANRYNENNPNERSLVLRDGRTKLTQKEAQAIQPCLML